jgi:spermidine/putrescine transport system substrate-binding protein
MTDAKKDLNPALFRGLTESRMSRRTVLRGGLAGASAIGIATFLAACGISGTTNGAAKGTDWAKFWAAQKKTTQLNFANWPLYIDEDKGKSESLTNFTKATGINVNYKPVIQDNASFYATVAPELRSKKPTGYDIVVMTNGWELTEMIDNGFVLQLDHSKLPNFAKYAADSVKNPNYDPAAKHSVVWQTGFTGIAYNSKLIDREITSFEDLLDPKFAGHVGMMSDNTELGSAALLALGIDPATSTHDDWKKAATWLKKQQPLVSGYYDQSYIDKLQNGDTWISQAWSGDVFQAIANGSTHLKFVTPKEGQMVWHDNMMIPVGASNPLSALEWMNFYYTPETAGIIEDWVNYVCPVPDAQDYILNTLDDPDVANSPLVFPTPAMDSLSHQFYVYKDYAENQLWNTTFNPIIQS